MFTIEANTDLGMREGYELVFLYADESGESAFLDMDVKFEEWEDGVLRRTNYLGEPVEVRRKQSEGWRRVLGNFYTVQRNHYTASTNNVHELKVMARTNGECASVCEEFARVQQEMFQVLIDETAMRQNRRALKFAEFPIAQS